MKKIAGVALVLASLVAAFPVFGAEMEVTFFPDGPPAAELPLGVAFYVYVHGVTEVEDVLLVNLRTLDTLRIPLQPHKERFVAGPVKLVSPGTENHGYPLLTALPGDVILARVAGGQIGLSATCRVTQKAFTSAQFSSPVVLPGATVRLTLYVIASTELPKLQLQLALPAGWKAFPKGQLIPTSTGFEWPLPLLPDHLALLNWLIEIPSDAMGTYPLKLLLHELNLQIEPTIDVAPELPPEVLLAHWDVERDRLDFTSSNTLDYDQLLWAIAHKGETLPHADAPLTEEIIQALVEHWQKGEPVSPTPVFGPAETVEIPTREPPVQPRYQKGLVAHWNFDEGIGDSSADPVGGHRMALRSVSWTEGKIGSAIQLDGVTSYGEVEDSDDLDLSEGFTIAAWVNLAQVGAGRQLLLEKKDVEQGDNSINYALYVQWTHDALALVIGDGTRRVGYLSDQGLGTAGEWHHVAVTFGNGEVRFYIDGEPAGVDAATIKPAPNEGPLVVGGYRGRGGEMNFLLDGLLDDLRIYSRVLTQDEVQELYIE